MVSFLILLAKVGKYEEKLKIIIGFFKWVPSKFKLFRPLQSNIIIMKKEEDKGKEFIGQN